MKSEKLPTEILASFCFCEHLSFVKTVKADNFCLVILYTVR